MYADEIGVAIEAVLKACRLCREVRMALSADGTVSKSDSSPVTVADFGVQAVINHMLWAAFPEDFVVAEEDTRALLAAGAGTLRASVLQRFQAEIPGTTEERMLNAIDRGAHAGGPEGRFWTLDPIDGTKGYIRGDQYAVALALIENGEVVLGVLGCPNLPSGSFAEGEKRGALLFAQKGGGTILRETASGEERRVEASSETSPSRAVFCESVESGHTSHDASADITSHLEVSVDPLRLDSQCKYAVVAKGEADVYMRLPTRADYQEKIWDHAAGVIVVHEAGGTVTDIKGESLDFSRGRTLSANKGVIATNGTVHDAVIEAIRFTCNHYYGESDCSQ